MPVKFKNEVSLDALNNATTDTDKFLVSDSGIVKYRTGTQLLSDLGITPGVANDVQNLVKAGVAINKGQAVYVTGADGTNIIVGLASNTSEATSSKTLGLLNATVAINGMADVVQIGRLTGLNTIGATAGDPVWLGTNGNLIYGLVNKPYAPKHLVFIGIVTRVNDNNGEIFVNVQNGFELKEIHDVDVITNVPINGDVLGYDGTLWVNKTIAEWLGYTPANANGTTNYVSKFTGATTLGDSQIFDNGSGVGLNTTTPNYTTSGRGVLDINGSSQSMLALSVGGVGKSFLFYTGTDLLISNESNGSIKLNTNGSEKAIITSSGNVGIGTTSPGGKLDVVSTSDVYQNIITSGSGTSSVLSMYNSSGTTDGAAIGYNVAMRFGTITGVNAAGFTERMRITSGGNVGIGTASPGGILDVNGATSIFRGQIAFTGTDGVANGISLNYVDGASADSVLNIRDNANSANRVTFLQSGNVGIGTTAPAERLSIVGSTDYRTIFLERNLTANTAQRTGIVSKTYSGANNFGLIGGADISGTSADVTIGYTGSVGANQIILYTAPTYNGGQVERMRITSNGNVGIGTTSPLQKLHVEGLSYFGSDIFTFNNGGIFFSGNSSYQRGIYSNSSGLTLQTLGSPKVTITDGGNVGIGTTAPYSKLDVTDYTAYLSLSSGINSEATTPNQQIGGIDFRKHYGLAIGTSIRQLQSGGANNYSYAHLAFYTNNGEVAFGNVPPERMRITSDGNVGIGTSSPSQLLHLYKASSDVLIALQKGSNYGYVVNDGTNIGFASDLGSSGYKFLVNRAAPDNAMIINGTGNVGIGTTAPSEKLDVYGVIRGVYTADPGAGAVTGKFLAYSPSAYGLVFRGYSSGAHSIQVQREANDAEIYPLSLQPNGGSVGIGTTSPTKRLDVVSSTNDSFDAIVVRPNNQTQTLNIGWQGIATSLNFIVSTNGSEKMRVTTAGNIGVGTASPHASALLHLRSTTQGFLPPVMRTGERDSISSPAAGLMIFNEDDEVVQVFTNGEGWRTLAWA